jgi:hypothetical protein
VARAISGNIFENHRVFLENCGLRVNCQQRQGVICKTGFDFPAGDLFLNRKSHGLSPWIGRPRLLRLTVNQGAQGSGSSPELGLAAAWGL